MSWKVELLDVFDIAGTSSGPSHKGRGDRFGQGEFAKLQPRPASPIQRRPAPPGIQDRIFIIPRRRRRGWQYLGE